MPMFVVDAGVPTEFIAANLAEAIQKTLRDIGSLFRSEKGILSYDLTSGTPVKFVGITSDNPLTICISCNELVLGSFDVYSLPYYPELPDAA